MQLQIGALCFFEAAPLRDQRGRLRVAELRIPRRLPTRRAAALPPADRAGARRHVGTRVGGRRGLRRRTPHPSCGAPRAGRAAALRSVHGRPPQRTDGSRPPIVGHPSPSTASTTDVVAIVVRAHHVMADGLALHEAATLLLDTTPQPAATPTHDWSPEHVAGDLRLSATSLAERARRQASLAVEISSRAVRPAAHSRRTHASPPRSSARYATAGSQRRGPSH